jgi:hypothetical protein
MSLDRAGRGSPDSRHARRSDRSPGSGSVSCRSRVGNQNRRLQALDEGKAGELSAHGDVLGRLGRDLLGEDAVQEIGERELLSGGVLEQGLQPLATLEQARPVQMLLQAFELSGLLARASMPATVS